MIRSEQAGFTGRRARAIADKMKKLREECCEEVRISLTDKLEAVAERRRVILSEKMAHCALKREKVERIRKSLEKIRIADRIEQEKKYKAIATRRRVALEKKTAQCEINKRRQGKIVYYFAAKNRARDNAARACTERMTRAAIKKQQKLESIRSSCSRQNALVSATVASAKLRTECSVLRKKNRLNARLTRAEQNRVLHRKNRSEYASRESVRFAASFSASIKSANSRHKELAARIVKRASGAAQRHAALISTRAEVCGAYVRRIKAVARDVAVKFRMSRIECREFISAKLKLAELRREALCSHAAAAHWLHVQPVLSAALKRKARTVAKMRRRQLYKERAANERRNKRVLAESMRNGAEVQRVRFKVIAHKITCRLKTLKAKEALNAKVARAVARHGTSPTTNRSAKAAAHIEHVLEVVGRTKANSLEIKENMKANLMLKADAACARREAFLKKTALKSGKRNMKVWERVAALKTETMEAKKKMACQLEFKISAASSRREAILRELSSKNGSIVKMALKKASLWRKRKECARREKELLCTQRHSRAAARRAGILRKRVLNTSQRSINGRRARQFLTC